MRSRSLLRVGFGLGLASAATVFGGAPISEEEATRLRDAALTPAVAGEWSFVGCERGEIVLRTGQGYICSWRGTDETGTQARRVEYFTQEGERVFTEHLREPMASAPDLGLAELSAEQIEACADGRPLDSQDYYWPLRTFDDASEHEITRRWYSGQLCAMGELPFARTVVQGRPAIRLLWLPSFIRPVSVRVFEDRDGTIRLVATQLTGRGGYAPGRVEERIERPLKPGEWRELLDAVERADFWSLPTSKPVMGFDGTRWIVEVIDGHRYHVVDRWSGDELEPLGLRLLRLSRLDYNRKHPAR